MRRQAGGLLAPFIADWLVGTEAARHSQARGRPSVVGDPDGKQSLASLQPCGTYSRRISAHCSTPITCFDLPERVLRRPGKSMGGQRSLRRWVVRFSAADFGTYLKRCQHMSGLFGLTPSKSVDLRGAHVPSGWARRLRTPLRDCVAHGQASAGSNSRRCPRPEPRPD